MDHDPVCPKRLDDAVLTGLFVHGAFLLVHVEVRVAQGQQNGRGHIDGRRRAHEHADEHGQGKVVDHAATQQVQGQGSHKGGTTGQDGTGQGLVDAAVDEEVQGLLGRGTQVLAQTVIDDDGVVERITHQGQQGRHDVEVDLHVHERQQAHRDEHVVDEAHQGAQSKVELEDEADHQGDAQGHQHQPAHAQARETGQVHAAPKDGGHGHTGHPALFEAAGDVHGDEQGRVVQGAQSLVGQVVTDLGAHYLKALDLHVIAGEGLGQGGQHVGAQGRGIGVLGRGEAQQVIARALTEALGADARQFGHVQALLQHFVFHGLGELHLHDDAAGEVDAHAQAIAPQRRAQTHQKQEDRDDIGDVALADKIYLGVMLDECESHDSLPASLDADALGAALARPIFKDGPRHKNGREHGGHDTQRQGDGKTADGARAELVQEHRGDDGGQVRVGDGDGGALETGLDGRQGREPQVQFFAYAFVDQHVGVHGHTDGQHDTGDAGQGQGGAEAGHARHDDEHGEAEHDVGDDAAHAVVDGHEHDHGGGTHQSGVDAAVDGFLAQGRTDGTFFQHGDGRGQRTGTQHDGQVRGFLRGELAGDDGTATGDALLDHRSGIDLVVQHDGHATAHVFTGDVLEQGGAAAVEVQADAGAVLLEGGLGIGHVLTGEHGVLFHSDQARGHLAAVMTFFQQGQGHDAAGQHGLVGIHVVADKVEFQMGGLAQDLHGAPCVSHNRQFSYC